MAKTIDYLAQFGIGKAPVTRKKNPAKRIGTAKPKRVSQVTKKAPSKRLVKNTDEGYFPNPVKKDSYPYKVQYTSDRKTGKWVEFSAHKKLNDAGIAARAVAGKNHKLTVRVVKI